MSKKKGNSNEETGARVVKMYHHQPMKLIMECVDITGKPGHCPLLEVGSRVIIGPDLPVMVEYPTGLPAKAGGACFSFLSGFSAWYRPLLRGVDPGALGLVGDDGQAYIGCTSCPVTDVTPNASGTVIFKIHRIPVKE